MDNDTHKDCPLLLKVEKQQPSNDTNIKLLSVDEFKELELLDRNAFVEIVEMVIAKRMSMAENRVCLQLNNRSYEKEVITKITDKLKELGWKVTVNYETYPSRADIKWAYESSSEDT